MSQIKVDNIQHTLSSNDAISLASDSSVSLKHSGNSKLVTSSSGVSVTGTCTATSFSGDLPAANLTGTLPALSAANLTSIPAANITGTLPAIDGSNLTNVGGGSLEFVNKTDITVSNSTTQINFTGLDHGFVYKVVCVVGNVSGYGEPRIYFYYDDGSNNVSNLSIIDYIGADPGSQQRWYDAQSYVKVYTYGYEAYNWEYEMDFYTGTYGWFRGTGHPNGGNSYAAGHGTWWGHLDPSNFVTKRIAGISCRHGSSNYWQNGTKIVLYKYKQS
tara:strand:+ start:1241 stop:2059 length:819 start_codon:yes stop_codon:yes gene_type:complete